jgi:peptidoglycan hydrolase CwlO-like protein
MVAGAALAGLAGGAALGAKRNSRRKMLGVPLPKRGSLEASTKNLAGATKDIGSLSGQVAELVTEVRRAREQLDASNSKRRRSPIEVVLDGLTARPPKG